MNNYTISTKECYLLHWYVYACIIHVKYSNYMQLEHITVLILPFILQELVPYYTCNALFTIYNAIK